jgi:Uncharacterised protein family (UPF0093)
MLYEILKALHIVAVIAWMAGLLYLPRLFVYHADAEKGSRQSEIFHNGVAWFLANVPPTSPVKRRALWREKVPRAICTRTACSQT